MSTAQRSFVQKVFKQSAADVRKNVSTCHLSKTIDTALCSSTVSPTEPLDYEEFRSQHMNIISRDPLKHILGFPQEDATVKIIPS